MAKHATTILTCAVLLSALASCSRDQGDAAGIGSVITSPASPSAADNTPTRTPTPKPALPKAADGNNLKACSDARCEVYVRRGSRVPVKASLAGFSTLVVSRVAADEVDYGGRTPNISLSAGGQKAGSVAQLNRLRITTVLISGRIAILRLTPA